MALENIRRLTFKEPDRARVQDEAIASATTQTERHLAAYIAHKESHGGKYVCADLFKATFPQYEATNEDRNRYNTPVHSSATVLAAEQFRRVLADKTDHRRKVEFLTGIPGAGKTTSVLVGGEWPPGVRMIWEGQLWRPESTLPKLELALDAGMRPTIAVVHIRPEIALGRTLSRFDAIGRGASINTMADIQGGLPAGLAAVKEKFGERIQLRIFDARDPARTRRLDGWENLRVLESEGTRDVIHRRLSEELERGRAAGLVGKYAYRQGLGQVVRGVAPEASRDDEQARPGRDPAALLRAKAFLSLRPEEAAPRFPELAPAYARLAEAKDQLAGDRTLTEEARRQQLSAIRDAAGVRLAWGEAPSDVVRLSAEPRGPVR